MLELLQRTGLIREQVESSVFVARNGNSPIVNAIIDPVFGEVQGLGELRHGQIARDTAGVRLTAFSKYAVFKADALVGIEFNGRKGLKEGVDDLGVDGIGRDILTHRDSILLSQIVTQIVVTAFVLHHHFVSALTAVDDALQ